VAQNSKAKELGDSLITWGNASGGGNWASALSLAAAAAWAPDHVAEPVYPIDPATDCPQLRLQMFPTEVTPGPVRGQTTFATRYSLWLKRQQTIGQQHQTLMASALQTIVDGLLGQWRNSTFLTVAGITLYDLKIEQVVIHNTLEHDLGRPQMRVIPGEILFLARYRAVDT